MVNALKESLVKWCSVNISDIVSRGKRLEASVFDVEAKHAHEQIMNHQYGYTLLGGDNGLIDKAYYPGRFKRIYSDRQHGTGFYLPSQINEIYPKAEKYISKLTKCNINELRLNDNTLLLTRSGTIGAVSIVSRTLKGLIFSDDVIRVTFKNLIDVGYIYTFLKSKVGSLVLTTNGYGSVITHLEPEHLETIPIPNAPTAIKEKINNLICHSFKLRDESNDLFDEATALLIDALKLPPIERFNTHTANDIESFSIKLSAMNNRADASYHLPVVDRIIKHLCEHVDELSTVGDVRISKDIILPGRFKRVYVDEDYGRVFIGGKQIGELDPVNKKYLSITQHGDRISKQLELHENMILITCSGTIGKVALVGKHWENWAANQHIIRIVPASTDIAGFIYIFLASEYGHALITRYTYGSVVDEIDDNHVNEIPIPILKDKEILKKINYLALLASRKRYESYCLEQEALKIMNDEVIFAK